jgi:hypothetical protein
MATAAQEEQPPLCSSIHLFILLPARSSTATRAAINYGTILLIVINAEK